MEEESIPLFQISSSHKGFVDRQNKLFNELDKVQKDIPQSSVQHISNDNYPYTENRSCRSQVKQFRGKESIFKRPEAPISKCLRRRNIPDYKKNPHKWTKYSLEDVRDEDISEKSNTAAALTFLKELENRNQNGKVYSDGTLPNKITFQKTTLIKEIEEPPENKITFKSSKIVMPEYVVGQKIKKERKNKEKRNEQISKQLALNHLLEDDIDI